MVLMGSSIYLLSGIVFLVIIVIVCVSRYHALVMCNETSGASFIDAAISCGGGIHATGCQHCPPGHCHGDCAWYRQLGICTSKRITGLLNNVTGLVYQKFRRRRKVSSGSFGNSTAESFGERVATRATKLVTQDDVGVDQQQHHTHPDHGSSREPLSEKRSSDRKLEDIFSFYEGVRRQPRLGLVSPCLPRKQDARALPQRQSYPTCAVIGASPTEEAAMGSEIDEHSAVFRAGVCAPVEKGWFKELGNKTTFCVSFIEKAVAHGARLILPIKSWRWLVNYPKQRDANDWDGCNKRYLFASPSFVKYIDRLLDAWAGEDPLPEKSVEHWRNVSAFVDPECTAKRKWNECEGCTDGCERIVNLSTGFYAVLLALEFCQQVSVYGFDIDTRENAKYLHIARRGRGIVKPAHAFPLERHLLKQLARSGKISLHPISTAQARMLSRYWFVGFGPCGKYAEDELRARMNEWAYSESKLEAEMECDLLHSCAGYHWSPKASSYVLLHEHFSHSVGGSASESTGEESDHCYMREQVLTTRPKSADRGGAS